MVDASPAVAYIHEPFNLNHNLGVCGARFPHWFTYVCEENEHLYSRQIKRTIDFQYNLLTKLKTTRSPSDARRVLAEYRRFRRYKSAGSRPLLKDPIAVFSAGWLSVRFNMDVVVLIRHPAAFVASLKVKQWRHPFSHFLEQPLLMRDVLWPFEAEIKEFARYEHDVVDQGACLWNLIHYVVHKYKNDEQHRNWTFVRHEDLSMDPLYGFRNLYERLGLELNPEIASVIEQHSSGGDSRLTRNSRENIWTWRERLTNDEIERIRTRVCQVSKYFYSDDEW